MGDITLKDAFAKVGDRLGLEGNIETGVLMEEDSDKIVTLVAEAMQAGAGHRFILCLTSSYYPWPKPPKRYIENLLVFLQEGLRLAKECEKK